MISHGREKVSEKTLEHLKRLNSMECSIKNRFKPGRGSWNRQNIFITCLVCKSEVKTIISRKKDHKFCSRLCSQVGKLSPKMDEVVALYKQGLTYKEIGMKLNKPIGTVSGLVYRYKIANRFGSGPFPKNYFKKRLPNFCELCGFTRALDLAHIIPKSKGGPDQISNLLILCPNCHHLFDHDKLSTDESEKLSKVIEVRRYATKL